MDDDPRPAPPRRLSSEITSWIEWFGVARLVTSACAVVIVCLGGWWLIRSPVPPVESSLPRTTASATATTTTPAVPAVAREEESAAEAGPESIDMVVHVAGAVVDPGVYRFAPGSRVADAVERAGGATGEGRPHLLNLAARLIDGMRIRVPIEGEAVDPALARDVPVATATPGGDPDQTTVVDVNIATVSELDALPGVGPATAAAIVAERERNGPFVNVGDLERVPGIGPAKLTAISELVTT